MTQAFINFPLFPDAASTSADRVDRVYFGMLIICGIIMAFVAGLVLVFCIKYRAGSGADRSHRIKNTLRFELTWMSVIGAAFVVIFAYAAWVFFYNEAPPLDCRTIYVVGKQWMWKAEHATGQREVGELHVPAGEPIKLLLASQDVIHSFYVPAFRMKQDAIPGRYTSLWFNATKPGEYHLFCAEYCGKDHSGMEGRIIVMEPAAFEAWLTSAPSEPAPAPGTPGAPQAPLSTSGRGVFYQLGCNACHTPQAAVRAPRLDGLWHRYTKLTTGQLVFVDEQYIRESILNPQGKITAGYTAPSLMPTYQGVVSEEQLAQLVEFIKSLEHGWPEQDEGDSKQRDQHAPSSFSPPLPLSPSSAPGNK